MKKCRRYPYQYCIRKVSPILAPILNNTNSATLTTLLNMPQQSAEKSLIESDQKKWHNFFVHILLLSGMPCTAEWWYLWYNTIQTYRVPYVTKWIRGADGDEQTGPYAVANKNVLSLHLKQLKVNNNLMIVWRQTDEGHGTTKPRIWNRLPEDVVSAPTFSSFRRRLKPFLFQQSYPDIVI